MPGINYTELVIYHYSCKGDGKKDSDDVKKDNNRKLRQESIAHFPLSFILKINK